MDIKIFLLTFIPIFVAVDALGILPIFMSFTQSLSKKNKKELREMKTKINKIRIQNGTPTLTIDFTSVESGHDSTDDDMLLYF